jgi:hypothetical protein
MGEAKRRRAMGVTFAPDEWMEAEVDGKLEMLVNLDGLSRLFIERTPECSMEMFDKIV